MNWLDFVSSVIRSLAWPATITFLVVLLRAPVTRVLLTLTHLKYKDLELDFGRELKQLEKQARAVGVAPQPLKSISSRKRDSSQLLDEAGRLGQDFPEPAIAVGWQAVEDELMAAVARLAISPDFPPYNSAIKNAEILKEEEAIDQPTFDLLNRMRNLRNMAVHGGHGTSIRADEAAEFLALAKGIVEKLRTLRRS